MISVQDPGPLQEFSQSVFNELRYAVIRGHGAPFGGGVPVRAYPGQSVGLQTE